MQVKKIALRVILCSNEIRGVGAEVLRSPADSEMARRETFAARKETNWVSICTNNAATNWKSPRAACSRKARARGISFKRNCPAIENKSAGGSARLSLFDSRRL